MSDRLNKRYYWLKLDRHFFKRHDIQIIESMPNGKDYILFYMKLLCESIDHNGELRFSDTIPYNHQMLSAVTNTNIDVVRSAIEVFGNLGMLEILNDETIYMTELNKMVGSETGMAKYMRDRKEQKALPEDTEPTNIWKELVDFSVIDDTYENAEELIDEVHDMVKNKRIKVDNVTNYIIGYADNKKWRKK